LHVRLDKDTRSAIIGFVSLAVLIGGTLMLGAFSPEAALTKLYTNNTYGFSLRMPATFTATEGAAIDPTASTTILLQNSAGDGVQILVSSWDEPASALTPRRITKDTGLTVTDPQPVTLSGATGLTFESDNPAFDGASSDAWFIAGGNIYQMSTYAADDALLKSMLASWTFF